MVHIKKNKKSVLFLAFEYILGIVHSPKLHVPCGLLLLATILKNNGHNVIFCHESGLKKLKNMHYDVVCMSYVTENANKAYKLASFFKSQGKKVILGGVHASMLPEEAAKYADHVIVGEGDLVINDVVEGRYKDKIICGKRVDNLDSLPFINRALVPNKKQFLISSSRGCIFKCNFCTVRKMFGDTYRFRSPQSVVDEICSFRNAKKIEFVDDNFALNKQRAKDILKGIKENGLNSTAAFETQTDITVVKDKELLKLFNDFDFMLYIGIETPSIKSLKSLNKFQNLVAPNIKSAIKIIKDYGIKVVSGYMVGSESDDIKSIRKNAEIFYSLDLDLSYPLMLTPYPGTDIYSKFVRENRMITYNWDLFNAYNVTYKPKKMKAYELQNEYIKIFDDLTSTYKIIKTMARLANFYRFNLRNTYAFDENLLLMPKVLKRKFSLKKMLLEHLNFLEKNNL